MESEERRRARRQRLRQLTLALLGLALTRKKTSRKGRILHILFSRRPEFSADPLSLQSGGGFRFALEVAKNMARGNQVRLILFSDAAPRGATPEGLEIYVLPSVELRAGDPWTWRLSPHLMWADVVHCHQFEQIGAALGIVLARLLGKRVYATDHGSCQDRKFWEENDLFRLVHGFAFMSRFSVQSTLPEAHRQRAVVVGGGYDPGLFSPPPSNHARRGILYVGRLLPHKGIDVLIRALPEGLPLRIVGPREDGTPYRELLDKECLGKNVQFVGFKESNEALRDEIRGAKVCVLPSVSEDCFGVKYPRSELFGIVLAEAQACGTPVICTNVGGMPEAIRDGETGVVVPERSVGDLRDAILKLLKDDGLWHRLSDAAVRFAARELAWSKVVDRCLQIYEKDPLSSAR